VELGFKHNLGPIDRVVRGVLALYLIITAISMAALPVWGHLLLFVLGAGLLFEAVTGY